jgi:hypothetical protein
MKGVKDLPKVAFVILGILVSITFLVIIISFIANILFSQNVIKEVRELFNGNVENKNEIIHKADLEGLPLCVQKWLEHAQVIGKEKIRTVRLKQKGAIRLKAEKPWMPVEAEQYFTIDEPGFIWKARVKMAPFLYFAGRDKYYKGRGNMLIKLLSLITVVDARGKEMDQGTLLRYLGETVWFPTAALSNYIKWEGVDPNSARATMTHGGVTASAVFEFNDKGEVVNFVSERYMSVNNHYVLETWSVPLKDYKEFNGIRIPARGEGVWNLKTGDFSYYQFEITEIEYNKQDVY